MDGTVSNGGMLYHEAQESKLCAVHCINTVLQGPFFSEIDLAAMATDLDQRERQMLLEDTGVSCADLPLSSLESHNVSLDGCFSIQVLEKALGVWDLRVVPLHSMDAEDAQTCPEEERAFICHLEDHWLTIRRVNGEWYNFNSLYPAPEHLSKFYLSAYLDSLSQSGWSIFLVRGDFPRDCPFPSSNFFGQWFLPEDADEITRSCAAVQEHCRPPLEGTSRQLYGPEEEDRELEAALAFSLEQESEKSDAKSV